MSGCDGCFQSQKVIDQALISARKRAKQFAVENDTNVFVYFDEYAQPQFMAEDIARALGIQPTGGIISKMKPVNEGA
jgi:prophage antirepressor-like protein